MNNENNNSVEKKSEYRNIIYIFIQVRLRID